MTPKKAYYYVFYKLYKSFEASPSRFWSEWKASLIMDVLIGFIIIALEVGYKVFLKRDFIIFKSNILLFSIAIVVSLSNYFIFNHRDTWKEIVLTYDRWPKKKNRIGTLIVLIIIFLIVASVIFMFYLMSQINWKQYKS